jgi:hypothetical protein
MHDQISTGLTGLEVESRSARMVFCKNCIIARKPVVTNSAKAAKPVTYMAALEARSLKNCSTERLRGYIYSSIFFSFSK